MKIKLLKEWDFFPSIDKSIGYFTGRKLLKERVFNEIVRRTSGAILLSGSRGVGKTALVYESLRNVKEEIERKNLESVIFKLNKIEIKKKIKRLNLIFFTVNLPLLQIDFDFPNNPPLLPIIINASQLDLNYAIDSDNKTNIQLLRKEIVVMLIRGLYAAVRKNDNTKLKYIEEIYKKALATEYRISQDVKHSKSTEYGFSGEVKVNFDGIISLAISFIISLIIFVSIYTFIGITQEIFRIISSILPSLVVLIFTSSISKKYAKSDTERETYIRDDNSVTNLEITLENVLEKLSNHFKPVYIIDELDFLEKTDSNPGSPVSIVSLVKTYKNLFNSVDAIFIFIAGQGTWNTIHAHKRKDIQHTLFTNSIFLPKPEFSDIRDYIKAIAPEIKRWDKIAENTALNYLVYKAKAEYYDLKNVINNNTMGYSADDRPTLSIDLSLINMRQGRIQEVIEILFEYQKYKEFERNEDNYNLLEKLYEVCDLITPLENFEIAQKDSWEILADNKVLYKSGYKWLKNLVNALEWLRFIENIREEDIDEKLDEDNGIHPAHKIIFYRWTGYYDRVPSKIDKLETQELKEYKDEYHKLLKYIHLIDIISDYLEKGSKSKKKNRPIKDALDRVSDVSGMSLNPLYNEQRSLFLSLSKILPTHVNANEINNNKTKIIEVRNSLFLDKLQLIAKIVKNASSAKHEGIEFFTENDNPQHLEQYQELRNLLVDKTAFLVRSSVTGRILLVCSVDMSALEALNTSIIKKNNQIRIININGKYTQKRKASSLQTIINIPETEINENLINTPEGKKTLSKIAQFIRWV